MTAPAGGASTGAATTTPRKRAGEEGDQGHGARRRGGARRGRRRAPTSGPDDEAADQARSAPARRPRPPSSPRPRTPTSPATRRPGSRRDRLGRALPAAGPRPGRGAAAHRGAARGPVPRTRRPTSSTRAPPTRSGWTSTPTPTAVPRTSPAPRATTRAVRAPRAARRRRGGRGRRGRGGRDSEGAGRRRERRGRRCRRSTARTPPSRAAADPPTRRTASTTTRASTTGTRRRRRRGAGVAPPTADGSSDDPPNTVTRVREPRSRSARTRSPASAARPASRPRSSAAARVASGRRRPPIVSEAEFLARRESVDRVMVVRQRGDLTQIAVLEDGARRALRPRPSRRPRFVGNVYLGRVQNVLPSMEAAFIDIGKGRNAVLYAGEVNWDAAGAGRPAAQDRAGAQVRATGPGPGHQGPDRPQGRPAHQPGQPARPLPRLRARRHHDRHLPQAARHRAQPAQDAAQGDRPRHRRRHRAHRRRGRQRGGAHPRRRAARPRGGRTSRRRRSPARAPALLYGEPDLDPQGRPRPVHRGLHQAGHQGDDAWDIVQAYVGHVAPDLVDRLEPLDRRRRTSSRRTASTSRSPRAWTARSGCPPAARWSSTAPRR